MRLLLGLAFAQLAQLGLLCARAAERCMPPKPTPARPPSPTLIPERYVRELADLHLARADQVLGVALDNPGSMYLMGAFTKTPDPRWPQ